MLLKNVSVCDVQVRRMFDIYQGFVAESIKLKMGSTLRCEDLTDALAWSPGSFWTLWEGFLGENSHFCTFAQTFAQASAYLHKLSCSGKQWNTCPSGCLFWASRRATCIPLLSQQPKLQMHLEILEMQEM